jgi:hypothetical protein
MVTVDDDGTGMDVVTAPDSVQFMVRCGLEGRGAHILPVGRTAGLWTVSVEDWPNVTMIPQYHRRGLDHDDAVRLLAVVRTLIESGDWRPGHGEPPESA